MRDRPNTIVQEDNAPAHSHFVQKEVYDFHSVQRLLWPGNSPEPTWFWMKKRTTLRGAPADKKTAKGVWIGTWEKLPQRRIQEWIERIPRHIQEVIRLEGGNEYVESRTDKDSRSFKGRYIKGKLSKRALWEDIDNEDTTS